MRVTFLICFLAALCLSTPVLAQECDPADESQTGMNICAAADYKTADARLNEAYREVMERLSDDAEGRKLLQTAQRAWITFRDAECAFSANDGKGGSIYPMLVSECLAELTGARTEQLGADLDCPEGDMSCPLPPAQ